MPSVLFGFGSLCNHATIQVFPSTLDVLGFVLPWMSIANNPVLPITLDCLRSTLFYLIDTTQFLNPLTLVSPALGVSFLCASSILGSSAFPLLLLWSHSVAYACPRPLPLCNCVI